MIILVKHDRNNILYILFAQVFKKKITKNLKIQYAVNHLIMVTATLMYRRHWQYE